MYVYMYISLHMRARSTLVAMGVVATATVLQSSVGSVSFLMFCAPTGVSMGVLLLLFLSFIGLLLMEVSFSRASPHGSTEIAVLA